MQEKIAVVLPVRDGGTGRSNRLKSCLDSYSIFTEGLSDIHIILDEDDYHNYDYLDNYGFISKSIVSQNLTLMEKINSVAVDLAEQYKYVAFLGDDIIFRTQWESSFIGFLSTVDFGLVYGNDFLQGERLATHPCVTSNMIRAVGFFGCPALVHNFFDNYWMEIVSQVGEIKYFPNVIMEHMHPNIGKASHDHISLNINNKMADDYTRFAHYMADNRQSDIEKIRSSK